MHEKAPVLQASTRDKLGTRYSQRIRKQGKLPAVVYGHGAAPASITLDQKEALSHFNKGEKVFRLDFPGNKNKDEMQMVLLKDLQYDYLGSAVVHVDFARVDLNERVRTRVPMHLLGEAIGLKQTYNIVQAVSLANAVPAKHNAKAFEAFWVRSRAVAQMAMLIAEERVSVCNIFPDQAYLAGIFHDCGVPVLMQRFTTYCKAMHLDEPGGWTDLAEEDQRFNADHCVVGYLVGKHWKLPEFICDAIRYHHEIGSMGSHAARTMVAIVQLAIHLYYLDAHADNPEWEAVRDDVAEELGLHADALPEFIDEILERYHTEPH